MEHSIVRGYINVYYTLNFSLDDLNKNINNRDEYFNILKKIYRLIYSQLKDISENFDIEFFDDGNIEEDGIKNIYFKINTYHHHIQTEIETYFNTNYKDNKYILSSDKYIKVKYLKILI